jgi:sugar phosphate isomerase/epimerase
MIRQIGYCTNVHAGADLDSTRANLAEHALAVKDLLSPDAPIGVGLWLSATAARKLLASDGVAEFAAWLSDVGLIPFTLNGFPYGDFHKDVVKHDVYRPTWCDPQRMQYTLDLIEILDALLPKGMEGSISTLPLMWGNPSPNATKMAACAANLMRVCGRLSRLEAERNRLIYLCLEPEPGCALQRSDDVVRFFEEYLLPQGDRKQTCRYLRICHDICHAAVMFEEQDEALRRYRSAGIAVGKVQVSSALVLPLDRIPSSERLAAIEHLREFAEDRYLHQTTIRQSPDAEPVFFEDLPMAIESVESSSMPGGEWRVHFHVPICLDRFGLLETTSEQILQCIQAAEDTPDLTHFEVETYAWGVLPDHLRRPKLADGIAAELMWLRGHWHSTQ